MSQVHDRSVGTKSARRRAKYLARQNRELIEQLVQLRKDVGLNQPDVAEMLGISQQAVSEFERMVTPASLPRISNYAQAIGALVTHHVAADYGQLEVFGDDWIQIRVAEVPSTFGGRVRQQAGSESQAPRDARRASNAYEPAGLGHGWFNGDEAIQRAAESKRTDFALAS